MATDLELWSKDAREFGWTMPAAPRWKRLPIIRHVRTWWNAYQIHRWYTAGPGMIGLRSGYDNWVLFGIWHGLEQSGLAPRPLQAPGGRDGK